MTGRGSVKPTFLRDGTPVWEVRHSDGTVSVLGAALVPTAEGIAGLETMTDWLKPVRRFAGGGIHDEYGRALGYAAPNVGGNPPLPTTGRDMTSYAVRVAGNEVVVGEAHTGVVRTFDPHHPVLGAGALEEADVSSFDPSSGPLGPVRTIDAALAEPTGTMSLVDADIVMIDGGAARICSGGHRLDHVPFPPCPTSATALPGVSYPDGQGFVWAVAGPLFARTGGSSFTEIAVYGGAGTGAGYRIDGPLPSPSP